jgi:hypothetical protein
MTTFDSVSKLLETLFDLWLDVVRFVSASLRSRCALAAENLFPRKQLAFARGAPPPTSSGDGPYEVAKLLAWREALTVVKPKGQGRPRIPSDLQMLITEWATTM